MEENVYLSNVTPVTVRSQPISFNHRLIIHDYFDNAALFIPIIDVLNNCSPDDKIEIHINSGGGSAAIASGVVHAINKCPAEIHCVITGDCASAATLIALACDSVEVADDSLFLFHSSSYSFDGNAQDVKEFSEYSYEWNKKLLDRHYENFLTPDEIEDLIRNKRQLYMSSEEFLTRYRNRAQKLAEINDDFNSSDIKAMKKLTKDKLIGILTGEISFEEAIGEI